MTTTRVSLRVEISVAGTDDTNERSNNYIMLNRIVSVLKGLFSRSTLTGTNPVSQVLVPTPPPEGVFSLNHPWPFHGSKPNETHVIELATNTQNVDGHAFYVWEQKNRRHLRTTRGTETFSATRVVWWLDGRKDPEGINTLRSTCGEEKCIKLAHLELGFPRRPKPVIEKKVPLEKKIQKELPSPGDRTKCITAKVWYSSKNKANEAARHRNQPEVRGTRPRLHVYDCPMCTGHHLTKQNPTKRAKNKPKGAW